MRILLESVIKELLPQGPGIGADEQQLMDLFLVLWPEQEANLRSFRAKPECECRKQIMSAISLDGEKLQKLLDRILALRGKSFWYTGDTPPPDPQSGSALAPANQALTPPKAHHLRGQVRDIADTPEAYTELLRRITREQGRFMGLSVCPLAEGRVRVYFY